MYRGIGVVLRLILVFLSIWFTLGFAFPLLFPFLLGLGLSLAAEPLVALLCRRPGLPRAVASGIGVSLTFCALAILLGMLCALVVRELGLLGSILPDMAQTARTGIRLVEDRLLRLTDGIPGGIRPILRENIRSFFSDGTALMNRGVQYILSLAGKLLTHVPDSALTLGTGIISAFMISAKLPKLRGWITARLSREKLKPLLAGLARIKTAVGGWLLAQVKLTGVSAAILLAGLLLLRIPYAPVWVAGICLVDAFPILGTGAVLLPWSLICFLQGDSPRGLGILGIYTLVSICRSVLEPRFLGKHLGLDPLLTLMALYVGYKLWGITGMLFAPLLAVTAMQLLPQKER